MPLTTADTTRLAGMAQATPRAVAEEANRRLAAAPDAVDAAHLHLALAVAAIELEDLDVALEEVTQAISCLGPELGVQRAALLAECRATEAWVRLSRGELLEACELLEEAIPNLTGEQLGKAHVRRGLALQRRGQHADALQAFTLAEQLLGEPGLEGPLSRLLLNLGVLHAYTGDRDAAVAALRRGRQVAQRGRDAMAAAVCLHNLGFVEARAGNLIVALDHLATAREEVVRARSASARLAEIDLDEAAVLAQCGLYSEAGRRAADAERLLRDVGWSHAAAEARLLQARVALLSDDASAAVDLAADAVARLQEQDRPPWEAQARVVLLLAQIRGLSTAGTASRAAEVEDGGPTADLAAFVARGAEMCDRLASSGWREEVEHARSELALLAARAGLIDLAEDLRADADPQTALQSARWHLVQAALAHARQDAHAARGALHAGLADLEDARATLGSAELRASWTRNVQRLAEDLARLAVADRDGGALLQAVDVWRGRGTEHHPLRASEDSEVVRLTLQLRQLEHDAHQVRPSGEPPPDATPAADVASHDLHAERQRIERAIASRSRTLALPSAGGELSIGGLPRAIAHIRAHDASDGPPPVLVTLVLLDGCVQGVAVTLDGTRMVTDLIDEDDLGNRCRRLIFALQTICRPSSPAALRRATAGTLEHVAAQLDALLLAPLLDGVDADAPVWLCPPATLLDLGWGALPSLRDRAFTLLPSLRTAPAPREARDAAGPEPETMTAGVVLVAGPALEGADVEVAQLADAHADATVLTGAAATTEQVLAALDGTAIAHVAAHGSFRADSARFSSLRLHDGPLLVHEVETLRRAPQLVVLSVCDGARSAVVGGDDVIGLSAALLRTGVRTLVAPVVAVPDRATVDVMVHLHRRLLAGDPPATALLHTRRAFPDLATESGASAHAFVVMGADQPVASGAGDVV